MVPNFNDHVAHLAVTVSARLVDFPIGQGGVIALAQDLDDQRAVFGQEVNPPRPLLVVANVDLTPEPKAIGLRNFIETRLEIGCGGVQSSPRC